MNSSYVVGIDVGGQTSKIGVVDARGTVLAQTVIRTDTYDTVEPYIAELAEAVNKLIKESGTEGKIRGIGVGAPNGNYYTGAIESAPNLPWAHDKVEFAKLLSEALGGLPVALTNDANAAAVGEMTYGAARGMKNFIMITLGTGVGSGIVVNGEVLYGHDGFAGELGHTCVVRNNGRTCGCGKTGCLETGASGSAVHRIFLEKLKEGRASSLSDKYAAGEKIHIEDIIDAVNEEDVLAIEVVEEIGTVLGRAIAGLINIFNPELIVIGGNVAEAKDYLLLPIKSAIQKHSLNIINSDTKIKLSKLGKKAGSIGSCMLSRSKLLGLI